MYQSDKERDSMRALYRMGLFSTVKLTLEGDQPVRRLAVDVVETWSREFYVQPGYGSYERLRVALGWRDKDWFGTARILNVEATLSELAQRGQASLSDLHLFGHDVEGTASLFAGRRQEPSFLSNEAGGSFAVTRHFTEHIHGIVGYQFRRSGISDVDPNAPPPATQDVNISSVLGTANWDTRDDPFVPRSGTFAQLSVEYAAQAIGSQIDFVRNRWTLSQFIPAGSGFVLGGSWRGGVIAPFGITDTIPLQERFFNGGENTVRCFREDEIGPLDSQGFSLGGEAFNVFSVEGRQRLHSLWDRVPNSFDAGLFVDAGNVEPRADKFWDFRDMRWGPGVGVRYLLPVGPIRLDLGYNPDQRPGEARWVLHLSVGMSF
jgi:outer membrane protein assembly factor BamA